MRNRMYLYLAVDISNPAQIISAQQDARKIAADAFEKLWNDLVINATDPSISSVLIKACQIFLIFGILILTIRLLQAVFKNSIFFWQVLVAPVTLLAMTGRTGEGVKSFSLFLRAIVNLVDNGIIDGTSALLSFQQAQDTDFNENIRQIFASKVSQCKALASASNTVKEQCGNELKSLAQKLVAGPPKPTENALIEELSKVANSGGNWFDGIFNIGAGIEDAAESALNALITIILTGLGTAVGYGLELILLMLVLIAPFFWCFGLIQLQSVFLWIGLFFGVGAAKWTYTLTVAIISLFANSARLSRGASSAAPFVLELLVAVVGIASAVAIGVGVFRLISDVGKTVGNLSGLAVKVALAPVAAAARGAANAGRLAKSPSATGRLASRKIGSAARSAGSIPSSARRSARSFVRGK
jgi:hypothetical protein